MKKGNQKMERSPGTRKIIRRGDDNENLWTENETKGNSTDGVARAQRRETRKFRPGWYTRGGCKFGPEKGELEKERLPSRDSGPPRCGGKDCATLKVNANGDSHLPAGALRKMKWIGEKERGAPKR